MHNDEQAVRALREENSELTARLAESESLLQAIRSGAVDAIVVDTSVGEQFFLLNGAETPYREMVETMSEGAVTVGSDGVILYSNQRFADMLGTNLRTVIGSNLLTYYTGQDATAISAAFQRSVTTVPRLRAILLAADATQVSVNMAMHAHPTYGTNSIAIVITDLTEWHQAEEARERAIRALRMVNACSDAIIHANDKADMLAGACRAMVALGGYTSAWIDPTGDVQAESVYPAARVARTSGHNVSAPTNGSVIRPRHKFILRDGDVEGPPSCTAREADRCQFAKLPLLVNDESFGCWVMCSEEPDAFNEEELALLTRLAHDVAFGLAALRDKQAHGRLAAIVESAGEAICGRALDGTITSWNNAAEKLFGYRLEEVVGRPMEILCPAELAGESDRLFAKVRSGETVEEYDTVRLARSGRRIDVSLTFSSVLDDTGCIVGAAVFLRDCTARKATEAALRLEKAQSDLLTKNLAVARDEAQASEERLLLLLQSNVTEALYMLGPDGTIETWNAGAERIKGYTSAEIIGRNFMTFFTPEDVARGEPARVLASARNNGHFTTEAWRVRKDGRHFLARVAIDAVRRSDGTLRGFVKLTHDVTSQRIEEAQRDELARTLAKARDHAEQANQAKSRFLATVTHDLRTPLHGILGYAELLTLEGGLNATQSERLEAIATAGHGLLDTINAVLDMSQIEANRMELWPVGIELPDFLGSCLDVIRPAAEAKGLALAPAPVAPLRVVADPGRLRQVVINLLGNAIKFTPAGSVEMRLRQAEEAAGFVRLEVADTGPGVRAKHRDRLFNAFERLNAEATSGIEGSGLGLAIAARLVQLMGGRIGYADNPGGGSVFWVELPYGTASPAEIEIALPSPLAVGRCLRILVVDDEALNRNIASGFLMLAGHEVVCVDNGAAAVEAAAAGGFDVILMDVRMPGMNGLEATRLIRALPPPRGDICVIAVTAQAFAEQVETCRRAGMDGHVAKPFKQVVLLAALENGMVVRNDAEAAALPVATAQAEAEPELPVLDGGAFDDIAECLSAADLRENLQILITYCEALLGGLHKAGMQSPVSELADIAHKIAGSGGTFGFLYVADAARHFERAIDSGASDTPVLASRLSAAIETSLPTMRECMGRIVSA